MARNKKLGCQCNPPLALCSAFNFVSFNFFLLFSRCRICKRAQASPTSLLTKHLWMALAALLPLPPGRKSAGIDTTKEKDVRNLSSTCILGVRGNRGKREGVFCLIFVVGGAGGRETHHQQGMPRLKPNKRSLFFFFFRGGVPSISLRVERRETPSH